MWPFAWPPRSCATLFTLAERFGEPLLPSTPSFPFRPLWNQTEGDKTPHENRRSLGSTPKSSSICAWVWSPPTTPGQEVAPRASDMMVCLVPPLALPSDKPKANSSIHRLSVTFSADEADVDVYALIYHSSYSDGVGYENQEGQVRSSSSSSSSSNLDSEHQNKQNPKHDCSSFSVARPKSKRARAAVERVSSPTARTSSTSTIRSRKEEPPVAKRSLINKKKKKKKL